MATRYCFVPGCNHNSNYNEIINFYPVPYNQRQRILWFKAVGRKCENVNFKQQYYCCETHFKDSDSYKIVEEDGRIRMMLKIGSLPSMSDVIDQVNQIEKSTQKIEFHESFLFRESKNENTKSSQTSEISQVDKSSQTMDHSDFTPKERKLECLMLSLSTVTTISDRSSNVEEYFPSSTDSESATTFSIREITLSIMKTRSKHYMGINKNCLHLIQNISKRTNLSELKVMLTLRKVRLNEEFQTLADLFEIDRRTAGNYFKDSVRPIAKCLKKFLKYVNPKSIIRNLPISFRRNYNRIGYLLDCFETQIEKPSMSKKQAKSFSKYKSCNTVKHLLSVTPDGLICYVSTAYGGRSSDKIITENCKLHKSLKVNLSVMADRGFKGIDNYLLQRGSRLFRPPSATNGQMTKKEVLLTKQIASLRIHVERAISRIRDFNMCKPHATLDNNLVKCIDDVVTIACGLVNVQTQLIKTN